MMSAPNFELLTKLATAFSPSAPIDQQALFAGRLAQFTDVMNAIGQKGQHVVLFGERGVGKTSLARVLSTVCSGRLLVASVNCDPTMDFSQLWHRLLREITLTNEALAKLANDGKFAWQRKRKGGDGWPFLA